MESIYRNTHITHKAFWMPLAAERRDVVVHDWSLTAPTLWRKHVKIVLPGQNTHRGVNEQLPQTHHEIFYEGLHIYHIKLLTADV